jgi:hypothetical protein
MVGETYAVTPRIADDIPPGAPTVYITGPLFPAEDTNRTLCFHTRSFASLTNLPQLGMAHPSPHDRLITSQPRLTALMSARVRGEGRASLHGSQARVANANL